MPEQSNETQLALMSEKVKQLQEHQEATDERISNMEKERNNALKWGISALGGMLVAVATWAASYLKDHLK